MIGEGAKLLMRPSTVTANEIASGGTTKVQLFPVVPGPHGEVNGSSPVAVEPSYENTYSTAGPVAEIVSDSPGAGCDGSAVSVSIARRHVWKPSGPAQ